MSSDAIQMKNIWYLLVPLDFRTPVWELVSEVNQLAKNGRCDLKCPGEFHKIIQKLHYCYLRLSRKLLSIQSEYLYHKMIVEWSGLIFIELPPEYMQYLLIKTCSVFSAICNGECGSTHPHSHIYSKRITNFTITG
jgi:hypothetical protein